MEEKPPSDKTCRSLPKPLSGRHPSTVSPLLVDPGLVELPHYGAKDDRGDFEPLQRFRCLRTKHTAELVQTLRNSGFPVLISTAGPSDLKLDQAGQHVYDADDLVEDGIDVCAVIGVGDVELKAANALRREFQEAGMECVCIVDGEGDGVDHALVDEFA